MTETGSRSLKQIWQLSDPLARLGCLAAIIGLLWGFTLIGAIAGYSLGRNADSNSAGCESLNPYPGSVLHPALAALPVEPMTMSEYISALDVYHEAQKDVNTEPFRTKLLGKRFQWTGYVNDIVTPQTLFLAETPTSTRVAACEFEFCDRKEVFGLDAGEKVTVTGVFTRGRLAGCRVLNRRSVESKATSDGVPSRTSN